MFKLDRPNWAAAKVHPEWQHDVKTYRIKNFRDRIPSDPLRHPKLEVFLPGKTSVPAKRYLEIGQDLDKTIFSLLYFMGPLEYVPDITLTPKKRLITVIAFLNGNGPKLRNLPEPRYLAKPRKIIHSGP